MTAHDNFTDRTIRDSLTGNPTDFDRAARDYMSIPAEPVAFLRTDVLIWLTEKVWINPQHVISVEFYAKNSMTAEDDPRIIVRTTSGNHVIRDRTLAEVVALIKGDAP